MVREAKGLLMAAQGVANERTAKALGVSRSTVLDWRDKFATLGVQGVGKVRKGRGRKPTIAQEKVDQIVYDTLHTAPPDATQWSVRTMARHAGVGKSTVQEIWSSRGIKPHRVETFKLSSDKHFEEKLTDVVELYMNPPEGSVVLAVDEKSQVQALDRTQPSLPMKPGRAGTMTQGYKRHGTTTLFAALNILTGVVLGSCMKRHRNFEFLAFFQDDRQSRGQGPRRPHRRRQLCHPQAPERPGLACQAPAFPHALRAHELVVAEPRGALVPGLDRQAAAQGELHERCPVDSGHRRLHRAQQPKPQALQVDQDCR